MTTSIQEMLVHLKIGSRKKGASSLWAANELKSCNAKFLAELKGNLLSLMMSSCWGWWQKWQKKSTKIHPANRLSCMMLMIAKIGAKIWPGDHTEEPGRKVPGRVEREAAIEAEADSDRQNGETDVEGDQLLCHLVKWWWRWWRWRQPPACSFYRWWRRHKELRVRWQGTGRQSLLSLIKIKIIETWWLSRSWAGGWQWMKNDSDLG